MKPYDQEKRKFNRIPFSYQDNIIGIFGHPAGNGKIAAHILNFSLQGLYFSLRKAESENISEHDKLILIEIKGPKGRNYILNIDLEIKRVLNHPDLEHFGYGCKFTSFPDSSKDQVRRFLEVWFLESRDL
jgi:hypothetical protein